MDVKLLVYIATYITMVVILFNILRYCIKINLLTSLILSVTVSFLVTTIHANEFMRDFGEWFIDYTWTIIVLSCLVTVAVMSKPDNKACNSADDINKRQIKWTVNFRIKKG